jgi:hypothetical protein
MVYNVDMTSEQKLDQHASKIVGAIAGVDAARRRMYEAIDTARDDGLTWDEIGTILGVTRQAAWTQYGPQRVRY